MAMTDVHAESLYAAYDKLAQLLGEDAGSDGESIVLVPTHDEEMRCKKELAKRGRAFGVEVRAFDLWVSDMWALYGDGRRFVDAATRSMLCASILHSAQGLGAGPGMIRLAKLLAKDYISLLQGSAPEKASLEPAEAALVDVIRLYASELEKRDMVEPSQTVIQIAPMFKGRLVLCLGMEHDAMTYAQRVFFDEVDARVILNDRKLPAGEPRAPELESVLRTLYTTIGERPAVTPGGALRFAFASGVLAEDRLILENVKALAEEFPGGRVVLASANPESLFYAIAGELEQAGIMSFLRASKRAEETDVVRAVAQIAAATSEGFDFDKHAATDFMVNALSRASYATVFYADTERRANRMIAAAEVSAGMKERSSEAWSEVVCLLEKGSLEEAFQKIGNLVSAATYLADGYRAEQQGVVRIMQEFAYVSQREGMPLPLMMNALGDQCVRLAVNTRVADPALRVEFVTLEDAAAMPPASATALFVCDMTAEDRPVKEPRNAVHTLLAKLGVDASGNMLLQRRNTYFDAFSVARSAVVLERSLNNADAEPSYAATLFDETVDCYRDSLAPEGDKKIAALGLIAALDGFKAVRDETDYVYALTGSGEQAVGIEEERPRTGELSSEMQPLISLPRNKKAAALPGMCLSASAIEAYLECPYQWFAKRRLNLERPDEEFGAAERGTFVHAVMERFYAELQKRGHERVTQENLEEARAVMAEVFDEVFEKQFDEAPGRRYVPTNEWERMQATSIKANLVKNLKKEAELLPGFMPKYFEQRFGFENAVPYAGANLAGCIDRVDVDGKGNAVVIDYKSSVKSEQHDFFGKKKPTKKGEDADDATDLELHLPRKIQTLLYAQVVRRMFGLNVVGALYLNPMNGQIAGAYDPTMLDPKQMPGISDKKAAVGPSHFESFSVMLDAVEEEIANRLAALSAGDILPKPCDAGACEYCPVTLCERRA